MHCEVMEALPSMTMIHTSNGHTSLFFRDLGLMKSGKIDVNNFMLCKCGLDRKEKLRGLVGVRYLKLSK